ncbi:MAG: hypothetical protein RIF34_11305, partial [Candidatus Kapaibacterium sp.]
MSKFILSIVLVLSCLPVYAGNLVISNDKPEIGGRVLITYETDASVLDSHYLIVYHFRENQRFPTAEASLLNGGVRQFIDSRDNFLLMKVINKYGMVDDNNGNYWDLVIYTENKPVKNAYLNMALSYLGTTG